MGTSHKPGGATLTDTLAEEPLATIPGLMRVLVVSGPNQGRELLLEQGKTYTVGKDPATSLVLADTKVSRRHLELSVLEKGVQVRDLSSKNGSFLQGVRFTEVVVGPGAVVTLGTSRLMVLTVPQSSPLAPSAATRFGLLLGHSLVMRQLFGLLERIAPTEATVLIEGETGTGKGLCARSIHQASARHARPFVVCDLAAASRTLIESELFGHERGAFTGANQSREGAFEQATGGSLFIDEVGELELAMQPRLLRAVGEGTIKRVGGVDDLPVDVRVIAATNRDLKAECRAGRFREDLFHRLAVVRVVLPPLRTRKEDIPLIVERLLEAQNVTVAPETLALLGEYEWPGNVRELRNAVERGVLLLGSERVLTPDALWLSNEQSAGHGAPPKGTFKEMKERLIATWEKSYLTNLLHDVGGNVSEAARRSGVPRPYLHELLKKHNLGPTST